MINKVRTSKKVATKASKILRKKTVPKDVKSLAGSTLSNRRK